MMLQAKSLCSAKQVTTLYIFMYVYLRSQLLMAPHRGFNRIYMLVSSIIETTF